jgi:uroporphyrinogen III methyltransferase / synthase
MADIPLVASPGVSSDDLSGVRVLVTRGVDQAAKTLELLESKGAEVIACPTIQIVFPEDFVLLVDAVKRLNEYRWVICTSSNGVRGFGEALNRAGAEAGSLADVQICAIGSATAAALDDLGLHADLIPADHRAEGVLEALAGTDLSGQKILIPRAKVAREVLPDTLREMGAEVDVITAYETRLPDKALTAEGISALQNNEVDVITFTSASTVNNLAKIAGPDFQALCAKPVVAAIGPITEAACLKQGLAVQVVPKKYTLPDLVEAIVAYLSRQEMEQ